MKQVSISEAKAHLSPLVDRAGKGKTFVIAKFGIPLAKLVPLNEGEPRKITFGTLAGKIKLSADIDHLLRDWLLDAFEGKPDTGG